MIFWRPREHGDELNAEMGMTRRTIWEKVLFWIC